MRKLLLLLIALTTFLTLKAQDDDYDVDPMLVELKAVILSAADSSAIPYANIINNRTHSGTITNTDGYFSLELLNIDTLVVTSVGYEKTVLRIPPDYYGYDQIVFFMKPILYNVGEVTVQGEAKKLEYFEHGKPSDIAPELRGDAYNEKPSVLAAVVSPASYLQYHFSKREKRKRAVREEMALTKNWEMHSKNYNKDMVMKLTGLNQAYADTFMVWFNEQNVLPYTASEYEVRESIIKYFELFKYDYDLKSDN
jgi:hypothetical protein